MSFLYKVDLVLYLSKIFGLIYFPIHEPSIVKFSYYVWPLPLLLIITYFVVKILVSETLLDGAYSKAFFWCHVLCFYVKIFSMYVNRSRLHMVLNEMESFNEEIHKVANRNFKFQFFVVTGLLIIYTGFVFESDQSQWMRRIFFDTNFVLLPIEHLLLRNILYEIKDQFRYVNNGFAKIVNDKLVGQFMEKATKYSAYHLRINKCAWELNRIFSSLISCILLKNFITTLLVAKNLAFSNAILALAQTYIALKYWTDLKQEVGM